MAGGVALETGRQYFDDPEVLRRIQQQRMMQERNAAVQQGANPELQAKVPRSRSGAPMTTPSQDWQSYTNAVAANATPYANVPATDIDQRLHQTARVVESARPTAGTDWDVTGAKADVATGNYGQAVKKLGYGMLSAATDVVPELKGTLGPALAIFAGATAKTANRAMLKQAEELAAKGVPEREIWDKTGWFKGADGKWRFEIDDSASKSGTLAEEPHPTPMRRALQHPQLYEAYPDMTRAKVYESTLGPRTEGQYRGGLEEGDEQFALSWATKDPRSTMLHEAQHAIQAREGYGMGSNGMLLRPGTPEWDIYTDRLRAANRPMSEQEFMAGPGAGGDFPYREYLLQHDRARRNPDHAAMVDRAAQETAVREGYRRSAGEVEARNVQMRRDLTPEERRARPPWETEDVPRDQQLVRLRRQYKPRDF